MLPQNADEHENGCDEDERQGGLGDGAGGEGLDVAFGASLVAFFVPAWECSEEEECYEGEDDGDDSVIDWVSGGSLWGARVAEDGGGLTLGMEIRYYL